MFHKEELNIVSTEKKLPQRKQKRLNLVRGMTTSDARKISRLSTIGNEDLDSYEKD
jgi:hypothetical protein